MFWRIAHRMIKLCPKQLLKLLDSGLVLGFVDSVLSFPVIKHPRSSARISVMDVKFGSDCCRGPVNSEIVFIPRPPLR